MENNGKKKKKKKDLKKDKKESIGNNKISLRSSKNILRLIMCPTSFKLQLGRIGL